MKKRNLIIIIVSAAVLLLVLIMLVLFLVWRKPTPADTTITNTNTTETTTTTTTTTSDANTNGAVVVNTNTASVPVANLKPTSDDARIISTAKSFTERYGSYSTDTHYSNIDSSRSFMTAAMSTQADKVITQGSESRSTFYSIVTKSINITLTDYTAGATGATVEVSARQTIVEDQAAPTYKNATARLTLKKIGNAWLVDSFRWL